MLYCFILLDNYIFIEYNFVVNVLIPFILPLAFSIITLLLPRGQYIENGEKYSVYECGFEPFGDARSTFDVHFYLVALLFIVFDLEIALLFPWIIGFTEGIITPFAFNAGLVFFVLLTAGLILDWKAVTGWIKQQSIDLLELGV